MQALTHPSSILELMLLMGMQGILGKCVGDLVSPLICHKVEWAGDRRLTTPLFLTTCEGWESWSWGHECRRTGYEPHPGSTVEMTVLEGFQVSGTEGVSTKADPIPHCHVVAWSTGRCSYPLTPWNLQQAGEKALGSWELENLSFP